MGNIQSIKSFLLIGSLFMLSIACHNNDEKQSNDTQDSIEVKNTISDLQKSFQSEKLIEWVRKMKKNHPRFSVDQLKSDKKHALQHNTFEPYTKDEWKNFHPYFIISPNEKQAIDLYSYNSIVSDSGKKIKKSAPDSEINLVDLSEKMKKRLLFSGPGTTFDQAKWQNDSMVLLTGESDANPQNKMLPIIWMINIHSETITSYHYEFEDSL